MHQIISCFFLLLGSLVCGSPCCESQETTCSTECVKSRRDTSLIQRMPFKSAMALLKQGRTGGLETTSLEKQLKGLDSSEEKLDLAEDTVSDKENYEVKEKLKEKEEEKEKKKKGRDKDRKSKARNHKVGKDKANESDAKDGGEDTSWSNSAVPLARPDKVTIDEAGYRKVVHNKNDNDMEGFIRRVIDKLGLSVRDEGKFKGMLPYYSGTKSNQTFNALVGEISQANTRLCGWVSRLSDDVDGKTASLDEKGYHQVAQLHNGTQMKKYIMRVIDSMNYKVRDKSGVDRIVPAHSCEAETQTLQSLKAEIKSAARQPGKSWVIWKKQETMN